MICKSMFLLLLSLCINNLITDTHIVQGYNFTPSSKAIDSRSIFSPEICKACFLSKQELTVLISKWNGLEFSKFDYNLQMNVISLLKIKTDDVGYFSAKPRYDKLNPLSPNFMPFAAVNFIISGANLTLLRLAIYELRESIWWNLEGNYFVEDTTRTGSCSMAYPVLEIVWKFDILFAIFVCFEHDGKLSAYTFNPYNNFASNIWIKIANYEQENGHTFVIFKLRSPLNSSSSLTRHNIFFEKTQNIGGFPIKISGSDNRMTPLDSAKKSAFILRGTAGEMAEIILTKLNATLILDLAPRSGISNFIDKHGIPHGRFADVLSGKYDFQLEYKFMRDIWRNQIITNIQASFCFVAPKTTLSLQSHILSLLSIKFIVYLATLLLGLACAISIITKNKFFDIILDVLRTLLGVATVYNPVSRCAKMVFISFIFLSMYVNYYFQTELSSLLVQNAPIPIAKTIDDLVKYNYTVFGPAAYREFFSNSEISKRAQRLPKMHKFYEVMQYNTKVAYINDCFLIKKIFLEGENISVKKDKNHSLFYVIMIRDYFSLNKRITSLYAKLFESGILSFRLKTQIENNTHTTDRFVKATKISMSNLSFAFICMLFGYVLSCAILVLELLWNFIVKKYLNKGSMFL